MLGVVLSLGFGNLGHSAVMGNAVKSFDLAASVLGKELFCRDGVLCATVMAAVCLS